VYIIIECVQGKLQGIVTCEGGQLEGMKSEAISWNSNIRKVVALCNDLVPLQRNRTAGPQDEKKAFKSVEAVFVVSSLSLLHSHTSGLINKADTVCGAAALAMPLLTLLPNLLLLPLPLSLCCCWLC